MERLTRGAAIAGIAVLDIFLSTAIADAEDIPKVICGGCVSPMFTLQGKGSIPPYGRIELDAIYSNRNTNPLDPGQFNGYATAAGKSSNASSTFNPRYSVFGVRGDRTEGTHVLTGVVETDFYSQTDNAGNISPRLRLAYAKYSPNNKTSITAGSRNGSLTSRAVDAIFPRLWRQWRLPNGFLRDRIQIMKFSGFFGAKRPREQVAEKGL